MRFCMENSVPRATAYAIARSFHIIGSISFSEANEK